MQTFTWQFYINEQTFAFGSEILFPDGPLIQGIGSLEFL